jgi:hypothetical protein
MSHDIPFNPTLDRVRKQARSALFLMVSDHIAAGRPGSWSVNAKLRSRRCLRLFDLFDASEQG